MDAHLNKIRFLLGLGTLAFFAACSTTKTVPEVPQQIANESSAVFKLVVLSPTPLAEFDALHYDFLLREATKGDFLDFLYGERVKECQKAKLPRCPVHFSGFATAFVTGDGSELWTVRHAFDPVIEGSSRMKRKNSLSLELAHTDLLHSKPKILLFDEVKSLVFDSRRKEDGAQFEFVGNPFMMQDFVFQEFLSLDGEENHGPGSWQSELRLAMAGKLTDVVKIKLTRSLSDRGLRFSSNIPKAGDPIFLLGYPSRTERSIVSKARYFDGHSFHVMPGYASSAQQQFQKIFEHYKGDASRNERACTIFERYFFYHDAPITEGFSGGPIVNAQGEVVSVQSSGDNGGGFGLNPAWIHTLEKRFAKQ